MSSLLPIIDRSRLGCCRPARTSAYSCAQSPLSSGSVKEGPSAVRSENESLSSKRGAGSLGVRGSQTTGSKSGEVGETLLRGRAATREDCLDGEDSSHVSDLWVLRL